MYNIVKYIYICCAHTCMCKHVYIYIYIYMCMTCLSFTMYVNIRVPSSGFKVGPGEAAYIYIYIYGVYIYILYNSIHVQLYILQHTFCPGTTTPALDTKALLRKLRFKHPHGRLDGAFFWDLMLISPPSNGTLMDIITTS